MNFKLFFSSGFIHALHLFLPTISMSLSILISGCNPKVNPTPIKSSDALPQQESTQPLSIYTLLNHGTYTCECRVDANNNRSWITSFTVSKDSIEQNTKTFANTSCQNPDETIKYYLSPLELQNTYEVDVYLFKFQISRIDLTPYTEENTQKLNNLQFAGYSNWIPNETKDVYIEILTDVEKSYFGIGDTNYFHIKLDNQDIDISTEIDDFNLQDKVVKYSYQSDI